jgi:hypothetical protein
VVVVFVLDPEQDVVIVYCCFFDPFLEKLACDVVLVSEVNSSDLVAVHQVQKMLDLHQLPQSLYVDRREMTEGANCLQLIAEKDKLAVPLVRVTS